jgi:hypothetical protein
MPSYDDRQLVDALDFDHRQIHKGGVYTFSTCSEALADDGTLMLALWVSTKEAHVRLSASAAADAKVDFLEGPTFTVGTTKTIRNRNRVTGDGDCLTTLTQDPTVSADGTVLSGYTITTSSRIGEVAADEWVLAPSTKYLLRLKNWSGRALPASIGVELHEETVGA